MFRSSLLRAKSSVKIKDKKILAAIARYDSFFSIPY